MGWPDLGQQFDQEVTIFFFQISLNLSQFLKPFFESQNHLYTTLCMK